MDDSTPRYTYEECMDLVRGLYPRGLAGPDVVTEMAPDGWERSPLLLVFHPTVEQIYEESVTIHRNMRRMFGKAGKDDAEDKEPTLDEVRASHQPSPIQQEREVRELVGRGLWDTFSENHEVMGPDGRVVDIGSWRASGGFIAEVCNNERGFEPGEAERREMENLKKLIGRTTMPSIEDIHRDLAERDREDRPYDYMDFYMGTTTVRDRADLSPLYRMIFRRLKAAGCDWEYHFPRIGLVDFGGMKKQMDGGGEDFTAYDPSASFEAEDKEEKRKREVEEMRAELDEGYRESVEHARQGPPPAICEAYRAVYGRLPRGWPPQVEADDAD